VTLTSGEKGRRLSPRAATRRIAALIVLATIGAGAHAQALPEPRTLKLSERVYVLLGPVQHANPSTRAS
jgi:hypothetical protein